MGRHKGSKDKSPNAFINRSLSHIGNTNGFKKGQVSLMKGKKHTKEANEKNRLAHLGKSAWNKGMKTGIVTKGCFKKGRKMSKDMIRKCLGGRKTPSSLELKMIGIIQKLQLPYKFVGNGKFFIERKCPDFINCNGEKIAVEVFYRRHKNYFSGGYENWKQNREEIFNRYGWRIIFLDETQVNEEIIGRRL